MGEKEAQGREVSSSMPCVTNLGMRDLIVRIVEAMDLNLISRRQSGLEDQIIYIFLL